jgi:hypothetical protein
MNDEETAALLATLSRFPEAARARLRQNYSEFSAEHDAGTPRTRRATDDGQWPRLR